MSDKMSTLFLTLSMGSFSFVNPDINAAAIPAGHFSRVSKIFLS